MAAKEMASLVSAGVARVMAGAGAGALAREGRLPTVRAREGAAKAGAGAVRVRGLGSVRGAAAARQEGWVATGSR